jgi:hypothetical protein
MATGSAPNVLDEYRLNWPFRRPPLIRLMAFGALSALCALSPKLTLAAPFLGAVALHNGIAYLWRGRFCTRLTTQGIEVRGYFNHFVSWAAVREIHDGGMGVSQPLDVGYDVEPFRGIGMGRLGCLALTGRAPTGVIRVTTVDRTGMTLRAPLVTVWAPDPHFQDKLGQIQQLAGQYGARLLH